MPERASLFDDFPSFLFLYGPSGSGKTTIGRLLAKSLDLPLWDLDSEIEKSCGKTIAEIFAQEGEAMFRERERAMLGEVLAKGQGVVPLGGGALLDPHNRRRVEQAGMVLCLTAPLPTLLDRVARSSGQRPLLGSQGVDTEAVKEKLEALLERRSGHYSSFPNHMDTARLLPEQAAWEAQIRLGWFRVQGMEQSYPVIVRAGGLDQAGAAFQRSKLDGPVALVSDQNVAGRYARQISEALQKHQYRVHQIILPPGETTKTPTTLADIWTGLVDAGLERGSSVAALGGGVVGDLAGFAAATFLRGVKWAAIPTTLLAMCDAAIGGKTGADLPQGKNLIGAFHPPRLVLSDPLVVKSLPGPELRSGMAEVIKAGVIGDPALYDLCTGGWPVVEQNWPEVVSRAAAVKIKVIEADPYEKGVRAVLNLGHTTGHAIEWATNYHIKHGEAVAIGMVVAAHLANHLGLCEPGLVENISCTLGKYDLPTRIPANISAEKLWLGMQVDKKRAGGKTRFVLPLRIGAVEHGIVIEEQQICNIFSSCTAQT